MRGQKGALRVVQVSVRGVGVNRGDEGLGQPRQVMTAGTYGPSGQPIFVIVISPMYSMRSGEHSEVVLRWHPGCM